MRKLVLLPHASLFCKLSFTCPRDIRDKGGRNVPLFQDQGREGKPRDWIVTLQVDEVYANYPMLVDTFPQLLKIVVS